MKSDGLEQLANLSRLIKKYIIFKEKKIDEEKSKKTSKRKKS